MKTVLLEIEVPSSDCCWDNEPPFEICKYFDNEGGHPTCDLKLGELKRSDDSIGILKCLECLLSKDKK